MSPIAGSASYSAYSPASPGPPNSAEPGVDWPPEARGRWPSLSPPVHLLSPNQDRSRPSGDPAEVRHGRPFDLAARRRPAQGSRRLAAHPPRGRVVEKHPRYARGHQPNPSPRGIQEDGSLPRPHCGVDQPAPKPARHRGASPPRPRLGLVSALLEGRRPPSTKASPRHLAQGGRARRAPSTPRTMRLNSTPSRRAFRSGRRIGDAVERSLGARLQAPRPESYKPASHTRSRCYPRTSGCHPTARLG